LKYLISEMSKIKLGTDDLDIYLNTDLKTILDYQNNYIERLN